MTRPLTIRLASSVGEIEQCFPIMSQLRLHLKADNFIQQVRSQMTAGYQLAYIARSRSSSSSRIQYSYLFGLGKVFISNTIDL